MVVTRVLPTERALIQLGEQLHHIVGKTVGSGGDGESHHIRLLQDRFIHRTEDLHRSVSVTEGLEITDILGFCPFLTIRSRTVLN